MRECVTSPQACVPESFPSSPFVMKVFFFVITPLPVFFADEKLSPPGESI